MHRCVHHWGRTGTKGQTQIFSFTTVEEAIADFEKKFHDKSGLEVPLGDKHEPGPPPRWLV